MAKPLGPVHYIYLAVGCTMLGIVITFIVVLFCAYFAIDITRHIWVLAIPVTLSVIFNILGLELYQRYRK